MFDKKRIEQIKKRIDNFIREGIIIKEKGKSFVEFFLRNSKNSLDSAKVLYDASTKKEIRDIFGLPDFNGFLWTINSSYYSMFFMARALLESEDVKIKTDLSIHLVVFDALVYYFYLNGRLEKRLMEDFAEANEEASEILGKEKAKELIESYFYEKEKRASFTYEMGAIAMQNKAKTSLERAKRFSEEIRKLIEI